MKLLKNSGVLAAIIMVILLILGLTSPRVLGMVIIAVLGVLLILLIWLLITFLINTIKDSL
jgi:hypothetical protein